jgi:anti-sigma regulatory factor (Ser/Thr protein kinase)
MPGSGHVIEPHGHGVLFYGGDGELGSRVGGYLGDGLRAGDGALVLATAAHRRTFASGLSAVGVDVAALQATGRLIMLDAATMLHRFMRGSRLAPARFDAMTGDLLARLAAAGRPVRLYAETVALLWDAGQATLAIELEELWNVLAARLPFSLLCGYPDRLLTDAAAAGDVHRMRGMHVSVTGADPVPGGAELGFPQTAEAVRQARRFVSGLVAQYGDEMLEADAEIVTGELAANAVLHACSPFTVTVSPTRAGVRIAVRDSVPLPADSALLVGPGHGLSVVARIADRLAVQPVPGGKVVWAELSA